MKHLKFTLFLLAVLVFASCEKDKEITDLKSPGLDLNSFEQNIRAGLDGRTIGYAYAIVHNGILVADDGVGLARTSVDGSKPMLSNDRMHVASISKNITTVAVLACLEDFPGLGLNSQVEPYFPARWHRGPLVNQLTFKDLLAHESGLIIKGKQQTTATRLDSLEFYIANGCGPDKSAVYSNSHHAFFRVILPNMYPEKYEQLPGESEEAFYARAFLDIVNEKVFEKAGIINAACSVTAIVPNLYYNFPYNNENGVGGDLDYTLLCGGFGFHLSAIDLAAFLAYTRASEIIIPESVRNFQDLFELGWWNSVNGDQGRYLVKLGEWVLSTDPDQGVKSVIIDYGSGWQAAVIVNSINNTSPISLRTLMRDAYDEAYF